MPYTTTKSADGGQAGRGTRSVSFWIYLSLYAGFILLEILAPDVMSDTQISVGGDRTLTLWGTNLAVVYGMGLIIVSIFFCHIYTRAAGSHARESHNV